MLPCQMPWTEGGDGATHVDLHFSLFIYSPSLFFAAGGKKDASPASHRRAKPCTQDVKEVPGKADLTSSARSN